MTDKTITVNKEFLGQMKEMMIEVFNEGCEKVIFPRLDQMQEEIDEKFDKTKKELREEFKNGQKSLNDRLEVVERNTEETNRKMDKLLKKESEQDRRISELEVIVKAN